MDKDITYLWFTFDLLLNDVNTQKTFFDHYIKEIESLLSNLEQNLQGDYDIAIKRLKMEKVRDVEYEDYIQGYFEEKAHQITKFNPSLLYSSFLNQSF